MAPSDTVDEIEVHAPTHVDLVVSVPGSKSLTNRALALAAIADGTSRISGALESEDTDKMRACLAELGVAVEASGDALAIVGAGGVFRHRGEPTLDVGTAGTVARFLAALVAASPGRALVDGTPRMRERPMGALLDGLREQGARIEAKGQPGHLPVLIGPNPDGLRGGEVLLRRPASSQFVSALAMSAALAHAPTRIVLEQGTPARPYVDMTLALMGLFGAQGSWTSPDVIEVIPGMVSACHYSVEPDASSASYFLALAAIHRGRATVSGLGRTSLQGDVDFAGVLEKMGARVQQDDHRTTVEGTNTLEGRTLDLSEMPDMALTVAVTALWARGTTTIEGVSILRHHESDRIAAAATELRKLGARVEEREDGLAIEPPANSPGGRPGVAIDTYRDHRMAMAFSLAGAVHIRDPGCVAKTFPGYFKELDNLGMVVRPR